jgi:hypothetical protein
MSNDAATTGDMEKIKSLIADDIFIQIFVEKFKMKNRVERKCRNNLTA